MKNEKLPQGLRDFSSEEIEQRVAVTNVLFNTLNKGGFGKIEPSQIDFAKNLEMERNTSDFLFKSIDSDGKLLAFAGDITPSILRMIDGCAMPQRVYFDRPGYSFKNDEAGSRNSWECGAQVYGISQAEGDAEAISIAADSIMSTGVKDIKISLSHAFLFRSIVYSYKPSEEVTLSDIKSLLNTGKSDKISEVCSNAITTIANKKGNITILQQVAESINNREAIDCLLRLFEIYQVLSEYGFEDNIVFDFSYLPAATYYNGAVFKIESGDNILAEGGHFNGQKYSQQISGAGFKYNIENIIKVIKVEKTETDDNNVVLGIGNSISALNKAYKIKKSLMESNVKINTIYKVSKFDCREYATRIGIANMVYVNDNGEVEE